MLLTGDVQTVSWSLDLLASVEYPLDVAHDVMIRYWTFLTTGALDEASRWEAKAGRERPCRPHL